MAARHGLLRVTTAPAGTRPQGFVHAFILECAFALSELLPRLAGRSKRQVFRVGGNQIGGNLAETRVTDISWEKWVPLVTERNDT